METEDESSDEAPSLGDEEAKDECGFFPDSKVSEDYGGAH
jgi:hypothetical protein